MIKKHLMVSLEMLAQPVVLNIVDYDKVIRK